MAASTWQEARGAAQRVRRALLGEQDDAPLAEDVVRAALKASGLRVRARRATDSLLSGAHAVLDPEARTIWVRADAPNPDRQVYIAHELAHFHLHEGGVLQGPQCHCAEADFEDPEATLPVGYGPRQRRETEANVFARELLLPAPLARALFTSGLDAHAIARQVGLPKSLIFAQLSEGASDTLTPPAPLYREVGEGGEGAGEAEPFAEPGTSSLTPPSTAKWERGAGGVREAEAGEVQDVEDDFLSPSPLLADLLSLDESQMAAARAERGPILVGAGPGTGKTRTLTARVLFLIRERGIAPENLLCLTFSRKAAEEMRERIAAAAPEIARRAVISTFHAYGLDLLRRHGKAAGLPPTPMLLDQADAQALLERRAATLGLSHLRYLHDPAFPLPDIIRAIGRAKEDMLTPDDYQARADAAGDPRLREVGSVFTIYEQLLREKGAMDYSDLICRALRLLEENANVRAAEQAQWKHVLVDEYQDVNRAGARLVQVLSGDGAGLWAVGDLRQAIYQFRGASPENVTRFHEDFPGGARMQLGVNYRSRSNLVELFGGVTGEGVKTWESKRQEDGAAQIRFGIADDDVTQAAHIARSIEDFVRDGYGYGDQVILCRTRAQAKWLRASLTERGIPVATAPEEGGWLSKQDVRDLVVLLSRAAEPGGPARRRFPDLPEGLPYKGDALEFFLECLWGRPAWARKVTDPASVGRLLGLARAFRDRASAILEDDDEPRRAFLRHLRRVARVGAAIGDNSGVDESGGKVRVLTVHGAKGLEFPIVFVPNLSAGKFPSRPAPALLPPLPQPGDEPDEMVDGPDMGEEKRLFFVALTRARDHLILSRAIKYGKRPDMPSPLLRLLNGTQGIAYETWKPLDAPRIEDTAATFENAAQTGTSDRDAAFAADATMVRATVGEAELYLRCPRRYFYEAVAHVPAGERSAYLAFRSSVEEALATPDPFAGLEAAWVVHGLDPRHPYAPLYKEAAGEIITRLTGRTAPQSLVPSVTPLLDVSAEPDGATNVSSIAAPVSLPVPRRLRKRDNAPMLEVVLETGTITIQPDEVDASGQRVAVQTFRRPPTKSEIVEIEPRHSLLQEALRRTRLEEAALNDTPPDKTALDKPAVYQRYLQNGKVYPVPDKPKIRTRHLSDFTRALHGIGLQMYAPKPADAQECPNCPYFFICPE